jgi:Ca2+-binding RTX toxin-like protein
MTGGDGSDIYYVGSTGDQVIESNATVTTGGTDTVYSSLAAYTLGGNVENGRVNGTGSISITGNTLNNAIRAGAGNNTLNGGSGNDTLDYSTAASAVTVSLAITLAQATGGSGSDTISNFENLSGSAHNDTLTGSSAANTLTGAAGSDRLGGGAGADRFILNSLSGSDTLTDFTSASDKIVVSQAAIRVGDGDTTVEGALAKSGPGGFAPSAELVVVTGNIAGSITTASAAAKIGSATSAYAVGAKALFMVDNGTASALYLFTAAGADALVAGSELTLLATLSATPLTVTTDLLFGA